MGDRRPNLWHRAVIGMALLAGCANHERDPSPDAADDGSSSTGNADKPVEWPTGACETVSLADVDLEIAVRDELEIDDETELSGDRMLGLDDLFAYNAGVDDLRGLECALALRRVVLSTHLDSPEEANAISDLAPLTELPNLLEVGIERNAVTGLVRLARAESLSLRFNPLTSVEGLVGSDHLQQLVLDETPIADLSPLARLPALTHISAHRTAVADLSGLSGSPALSSLDVSDTAVTDIAIVAELPQLRRLSISGTGVSDLSVLADRPLYGLYARAIEIDELPADLAATSIDLSDNGLTDLEPMLSWARPDEVALADNLIDDVTPLLSLPWTLEPETCLRLDLSGNPLLSPDAPMVLEQICATFIVEIFADDLSCTHPDCPPPPP